ncbi:fungal-specific transcription factor domain-containing protein [Massariosphaeria phaeospora]|uniref:Fungal-specific transcription factor domain-containing protein n=1 Tax=Massariosphaeria phaeospora TaxID=100035 RepID=A0A7C8M855_9PLEO|nr:fungal-specific transcription factor domain-containing protein [Massariosphaeria phaeospora]
MMSASLHQYQPAFSHLPTPAMVDHHHHHQHHLAAQHMGHSPLDTLAHTSSQYAALQFHQNRHVLPGKGLVKPYANGPIAAAPRQRDPMLHDRSGRGGVAAGPVRRRISRACDQCNQLRTKCDGRAPCAHCIEFGLTCEYMRERKKRGKASRKDIAQQQAAAAAAATGTGTAPSEGSMSSSPQSRNNDFPNDQQSAAEPAQGGAVKLEGQRPLPELPPPSIPPPPPGRSASMATTRDMDAAAMYQNVASGPRTMSLGGLDALSESGAVHQMPVSTDGMHPMQPPRIQTQGLPMHNPMQEYTPMDEFHRNMMHQSPHPMMQNAMHPIIPSNGIPEYSDSPYSMMSPQSAQASQNPFRMPTESPMPGGFMGNSPVSGSPEWLSLPSPSTTMYAGAPHPNAPQHLRYPVLQPLVPHLTNIMPVSLACDLLELYFQSSSSAFMQPVSPYVLGYVFRKRSFLRQTSPRVCSPALLASMLWIGCLTSESPYLASSPSARSQLSEKLINLTISLLKPLVHQSPGDDSSPTTYSNSVMINGVTHFGMPAQESEIGLPGAPGGVDDIATYMHLAIVISASEYKAASLRWWNAAWALARELKLGKEVPLTPPPEQDEPDAPGEVDMDHINHPQNTPVNLTEEQREERRRIWWLLYTVDRHLALCYNRPLSLLDIECNELLQPVDDPLWQAGEFYNGDSAQSFSDLSPLRRRGPAFECTGHSILGFFLPLMTILGEIVDLNHARNHPRFGTKTDWDDHAAEITRQLEAYGETLQELRAHAINEANIEAHEPIHPGTPSARSVNSSTSRVQESLMRARIVVAYGTHLMHTLHILLNGKWDPIALLDDNDLWISSQSFIDATGHAVAAAEALNEILELDPDLSFMPFFFGIYLLQGSFLLLLIADKLQGEANPNVVKACETIVRAHEACIVTLNTEYQRNFRKVMRSALQQVRGRGMDEHAEFAQLRRREMLSLYRWQGDGTGLAL